MGESAPPSRIFVKYGVGIHDCIEGRVRSHVDEISAGRIWVRHG